MGKGGGKGGKSTGKIVLSLAGAAIGGGLFGAGWFGAGFQGAMYGLSLGSTVANAFFGNKQSTGQDASVFDSKMNAVDSTARIPLIYGCQKIGGLQSYHKTSTEQKTLWKHVIACEGEIEDAFGITANGYMIPSSVADRRGRDYNQTVFKIVNHKYRDATVSVGTYKVNIGKGRKSYKCLYLQGGGNSYRIPLFSDNDKIDPTLNMACANFSTLYQHLIGAMDSMAIPLDGWEVQEPVIISDAPKDLAEFNATNCYENPIAIRMGNQQCGDSVLDFYRGASGQAYPSNYLAVGGYPKLAYMNATLKYTEKLGSGNPVLTAIIKGRRILDIRDGQIKYSKNPALCLYDYMVNDIYGAGEYITEDLIDKDSFIDVANYCDGMVTYIGIDGVTHSEPRYQLDMIIAEKKSHLEVMQDILKTFCGFLVFSNDRIALRCERQQSSIYHFDDDNIIEKSVSAKANSLDQSPNRIIASYVEPALDYTAVKVIVDDTVNQQPQPYGRGQVVEQEISMGGIIRQTQALRVAKIYRDIIRLCPVTVTFKTGAMASHLEPGDVITISRKFIKDDGTQSDLLTDIPLRIQEIKEDKGEYEITARQYNPSIYDDSLGASLQTFPYVNQQEKINIVPDMSKPVKNVRIVARKTSPTMTASGAYSIDVQWDKPDDVNYKAAQVWYKSADTTPADIITVPNEGVTPNDLFSYGGWQYAGTDATHIVIANAWYRDKYVIKIIPVDTQDKTHEDYETLVTYKVSQRTAIPDQPSGFKIEFGADITASWNAVSNTDVDFYELRYDGKLGNPDGLIAKVQATQTKLSLTKRQATVYLYACNTTGRYSNAASFSYNVIAPPKPNVPTVSSIFGALSIKIDDIPPACSYANIYIDDVAHKIIGNTYQYSDNGGTYKVCYTYGDAFGEGEKSDWVLGTIKQVIDPEWIKDGTLTKDKLDKNVNDTLTNNTNDIATNAANISKTNTDITNMVAKLNSTDPATSYDAIAEAYKHGVDAQNEITRVVGVLNNPSATDQFSSITQANDRITSVVASLNGDASTSAFSSIKQTADGLSSLSKAVTTIDGQTTQNTSQITQNAKSISSIVTNLNATDATKSPYTSIKQTADSLTSLAKTVTGQGSTLTQQQSQITQNANSISSVVSKLNITDPSKSEFSSIKQTSDNITSIVSALNGDASTSPYSSIKQTANSVSTIVSNLNGDPKTSSYTALTQLNDSIGLKVSKGDVINQINLSSEGTLIDGKFLHVTGTTKFDSGVVAKNIEAGSISADKLSVDKLSAISANLGTVNGGTIIGTTLRNANGSFYVDGDGNVHGVNISGSSIDASNIYSNGRQLKPAVFLQQRVYSGQKLSLPSGYDMTKCLFRASINTKVNHLYHLSVGRYVGAGEFTNINNALSNGTDIRLNLGAVGDLGGVLANVKNIAYYMGEALVPSVVDLQPSVGFSRDWNGADSFVIASDGTVYVYNVTLGNPTDIYTGFADVTVIGLW